MRILLRVVSVSILCLVATAFGQQPVSAVCMPGDVVRIAVTLAEPAKARVYCDFSRTSEYKPDYSGPQGGALKAVLTEGNSFPSSSQSEYVVSMKIPKFTVGGTYRLDSVTITIATEDPRDLDGLSKTYSGTDIANFTIEVRNPPPHFPAIKSIAIAPAR